jgi:hypothetical protein
MVVVIVVTHVQVWLGPQQVNPVQAPMEVVHASAATPALMFCISGLDRLEIACLFSFNFLVGWFGFIIVI